MVQTEVSVGGDHEILREADGSLHNRAVQQVDSERALKEMHVDWSCGLAVQREGPL